MTLEIRFIKNNSVGAGIHFVVDDGCKVDINDSQILQENKKKQ
jgi:hypothetical protein